MDRYIRVKKIGEGSFGKALLVKKRNDGKHYVIKEISISRMKPREREESRKEVKVLSQLKHPNIVTYQESFEESGNLYIVMDYCDGGDLYKKINSQRGIAFSEEQVMDWFVQICLGLKHVHDRKILHRDIKSQNIFLTRHGIVKMGDFGIARVLHSTVELARTCIGTPYYLSPEIVENRPYNNKSDVWSLGCVFYEMLTLKHAFEAGNMKNLVLKIIRGSYPPIPLRYSADVRLLVAQLLKRNASDRPSVNTVLKKNFIQKRIEKFLSKEVMEDEFSHTVLHRKPFGVAGQRPLPPRQLPHAKPGAAAPKFSQPKAKYGVSVANKKPPKKPSSGGEPARKPVRAVDKEVGKLADQRKDLNARERRRKELMQNQDQMYQQHMKKVQQQRWERQQRDQINRDREQAWKSTMSVGLSPDKDAKKPCEPSVKPVQPDVVNKQEQVMHKYQVPPKPVSAREHKENMPVQEPRQRPVSASNAYNKPPHPTPAWEAARQGQINRAQGAEAAEKARLKEEFLGRKRAAAMNKRRGQADYGGYEYKPPVQNAAKAAGNNGARNGGEKDYLTRLEAIRRQNYAERLEIQRRMAGIRAPVEAPSAKKEDVKVLGDPRYDPDARRKKIAALKSQAEERAAILRKQLEARKKAVLERLNREGKEKVEQERQTQKADGSANERPVHPAKKFVPDEKPVVVSIGLETALKQVGVTTLFRSNSENDISNIALKEEDEGETDHAPRKQWGAIPFQPRMLPLEVTASHMEATSASDAVIKPGEGISAARKQWGQPQRTQIVSALGRAKLQTATTLGIGDEMDAGKTGVTSSTTANPPVMQSIGQTITVSKEAPKIPGMGVTVTVPRATDSITLGVTVTKPSPQTVILKKDITTVTEEEGEDLPEVTLKPDDSPNKEQKSPSTPMTAWGEEDKTSSPKESPHPKSPRSPRDDRRAAYEEFLKSSRQNLDEKENDEGETQPLFEKVPPKEEKGAIVADDLEVQDLSVDIDESSFHTADGSPNRSSRSMLLETGNYDTDSKRLRTCSMPDLRLLFHTASPAKGTAYVDQQFQEEDQANESQDEEEEEDEDEMVEEEEDQEDEEGGDGDDEDFGDDEDSELGNESDNEEEEVNEYENMLASMRDVLVSSARSPSPMKSVGTAQSMEWDPIGDTAATVDDSDGPKADSSGRSSELSNLNEDWDSGDGEDDDEDRERHGEDDDSVFQRLEESRVALEQQLGFDKFLRVYKYLQAVQENEDESADVGSSSEISELLGDKEHLYPKILYLVIADFAYSEDNN